MCICSGLKMLRQTKKLINCNWMFVSVCVCVCMSILFFNSILCIQGPGANGFITSVKVIMMVIPNTRIDFYCCCLLFVVCCLLLLLLLSSSFVVVVAVVIVVVVCRRCCCRCSNCRCLYYITLYVLSQHL